ncbi:MAG: phosphatidate cytidylyltransferase [Betaproteobacteria bacterium]|nr:phosphatidate cytidylyltransferase [Betaproteobacteria bacterium]
MLSRRIITAAILIPLALAGLFLLSQRAWGIASAVFIAIGAWEWGTISRWGRSGRAAFVGLVALSCLLFLWLGATQSGGLRGGALVGIWGAAVALWMLGALPWLAFGWHARSAVLLVVAGWWVLVPAWLAVVALQPAPGLLLALLATIWVADSGAYFVGRRFGRRKLAPRVSPGKSWEGVFGALLCVAVYLWIVEAVAPGLVVRDRFGGALVFLEAMVVLSIIGDLFESWMKREAGVKDSGWILPGHGGVLDRIDSLTSALPAAALYVFLNAPTP